MKVSNSFQFPRRRSTRTRTLSFDADRQLHLKSIETLRQSLVDRHRSDAKTNPTTSTESLLIRRHWNRTDILTSVDIIIIIIHTLPEGIVTFVGAMESISRDISLRYLAQHIGSFHRRNSLWSRQWKGGDPLSIRELISTAQRFADAHRRVRPGTQFDSSSATTHIDN